MSDLALRRWPEAAPGPVDAAERARRRVVVAVLVIYLLAIFEGCLRKYVVPQFGQYVFFIRDPFLVYAYIVATRFGLWPRNSVWFHISVLMCVVGVVLFVLQAATGGSGEHRLILGVHGWRSYFFYAPLAFLVGEQFRREDVMRFARLTLWLAIPIAVLVVVQFSSAPNAPVNVGVSSDEALQFKGMGLNREHVRTTGPFTSSAGQNQFVVTAAAFLLALMLMPAPKRRFAVLPLVAATCAVLTCIALGGSRGMTIHSGINVVFALMLGVIGRGGTMKLKALALPLSVVVLAVVLYPIVFPAGFETFMTRWSNAAKVESNFDGGVFGRALYGFVDFIRLIDVVPTLGYGLGYGSNASILLQAQIDGFMPGYLSETDFSRHMVDIGPAFGMGYIVFRFALVIWLGQRVWTATRRVPDPLPLMLFTYVGLTVLSGQITGNGTINVYGWLFAGLCIAATRHALAPAAAGTATAIPQAAVRFARPQRPRAPRALAPARRGAATSPGSTR